MDDRRRSTFNAPGLSALVGGKGRTRASGSAATGDASHHPACKCSSCTKSEEVRPPNILQTLYNKMVPAGGSASRATTGASAYPPNGFEGDDGAASGAWSGTSSRGKATGELSPKEVLAMHMLDSAKEKERHSSRRLLAVGGGGATGGNLGASGRASAPAAAASGASGGNAGGSGRNASSPTEGGFSGGSSRDTARLAAAGAANNNQNSNNNAASTSARRRLDPDSAAASFRQNSGSPTDGASNNGNSGYELEGAVPSGERYVNDAARASEDEESDTEPLLHIFTPEATAPRPRPSNDSSRRRGNSSSVAARAFGGSARSPTDDAPGFSDTAGLNTATATGSRSAGGGVRGATAFPFVDATGIVASRDASPENSNTRAVRSPPHFDASLAAAAAFAPPSAGDGGGGGGGSSGSSALNDALIARATAAERDVKAVRAEYEARVAELETRLHELSALCEKQPAELRDETESALGTANAAWEAHYESNVRSIAQNEFAKESRNRTSAYQNRLRVLEDRLAYLESLTLSATLSKVSASLLGFLWGGVVTCVRGVSRVPRACGAACKGAADTCRASEGGVDPDDMVRPVVGRAGGGYTAASGAGGGGASDDEDGNAEPAAARGLGGGAARSLPPTRTLPAAPAGSGALVGSGPHVPAHVRRQPAGAGGSGGGTGGRGALRGVEH